MAKYKILYWYDIPSMVRAEDEDDRASLLLDNRFQLAIDEAAMAAKVVGEDEYSDGFQWTEEQIKEGSAQEVAQVIVESLEAKYPEIDVQAQVQKLKQMKKDSGNL